MNECPKCYKEVTANAEFCPHCGENLKKDVSIKRAKLTSTTIMVIIVGILVILFICVLGSLYNVGYKDGYDRVEQSFLSSFSSGYKRGYERGKEDVYWYNHGCNDKYHRKPAQNPEIKEYLDGYNSC